MAVNDEFSVEHINALTAIIVHVRPSRSCCQEMKLTKRSCRMNKQILRQFTELPSLLVIWYVCFSTPTALSSLCDTVLECRQ
jgi:hypothetical protein